MTKAEIAKGVYDAIMSLPDDAKIEVEATAGITRVDGLDGYVRAEPNGTRTLAIKVNGGSADGRRSDLPNAFAMMQSGAFSD